MRERLVDDGVVSLELCKRTQSKQEVEVRVEGGAKFEPASLHTRLIPMFMTSIHA
jgi:hypothetical protein